MTHDEQWDEVIRSLRDRFNNHPDMELYLEGIATPDMQRVDAAMEEAPRARARGENPLLWKLANG